MSLDPHASLDQSVLDMIENSPTGAVPHTPTYQDSLRRLHASQQVYTSADYKDGHVTARSLAKLPSFHADNLQALISGAIDVTELETNARIFDRYLQSLPAALRPKAEIHRLKVVGRPVQHRKHHGPGDAPAVHDPVHSLFLVPGTGPHPGLPGNYLHGSVFEVLHPGAPSTWRVQLRDNDDGASLFEASGLAEALGMMQEVVASAPFHLSELTAFGFKSN